MKDLLLLPFFLICQLIGFSQNLTPSDYRKDAQYLVEIIEASNPALLKYNPDFNSKIENLLASDFSEMGDFEFYALVNQILANVNEGHYKIVVDKDGIYKGFFDNSYSYLPLSVRIMNGKIYVWNCFTDSCNIKKGDEIISINNKSSAEIIRLLSQHISSDGDIQSSIEHQLSKNFASNYYLFVEQPAEFNIQFEGNSSANHISIPALSRDKMLENIKLRQNNNEMTSKKKSDPKPSVYHFQIDTNTAYLQLRTFNRQKLEQQKIKPKSFYSSIFKQINENNIKNLIIDLRGNSGGIKGMPIGILPHTIKSNFGEVYRTSYSPKGKKKSYKLPKKKHKFYFRGKIFVLVDGSTFSSGSTMARYLREYTNAIVIGEETASRYEGFVAGSKKYFNLPHSNIQVGLWQWHIEFPTSSKQNTKNRGLIPDHLIKYNIEDLMEEKDKIKIFTNKLINVTE